VARRGHRRGQHHPIATRRARPAPGSPRRRDRRTATPARSRPGSHHRPLLPSCRNLGPLPAVAVSGRRILLRQGTTAWCPSTVWSFSWPGLLWSWTKTPWPCSLYALTLDRYTLALHLVRLDLGQVRLSRVPAVATATGLPLGDELWAWDARAGGGLRVSRRISWSPVERVKRGDARHPWGPSWSQL